MAHIELSSKNYFHNLDVISKQIGSKDKLSVVLKDNAYGHGLVQIAKLSYQYGIKKAVVRSREEALEIKDLFEEILIFNPASNEDDEFIYSINSSLDLDSIKAKNIALKINTGMNRNGISCDEFEKIINIIIKKKLNLKSIFTHFSDADSNNNNFETQLKTWQEFKQKARKLLKQNNIQNVAFHSQNSAATFRVHTDDDMVRCGIAIYGYSNPSLKPVLSLYAKKTNEINLKQNESVGYSSIFVASKNMTISTYDIGYADGIFRFDGSQDIKTADNESFLGICSMDYISVESTEDEICVFNNAEYLASKFNTISYEVLVKLSPNLTRIIETSEQL
ncbi:MAG: Alanine racemase (EC [uncultured Campylobacterales bacterium]|uniref:Alanine racemase (EC) n=1 Tax=uncultured Campylobacterales bacterium TaxID=352960 RepID=A0A6S6TKE2_9BACT|nr:MAG: Alanine racemase (EC [uncultured Campylobacterales bacterium]